MLTISPQDSRANCVDRQSAISENIQQRVLRVVLVFIARLAQSFELCLNGFRQFILLPVVHFDGFFVVFFTDQDVTRH